uniref:Uncharacterized protein n=1 Tax=Macaca fascicularis TaxID=9541 RepID=A0A7N9D4I2_MACFA
GSLRICLHVGLLKWPPLYEVRSSRVTNKSPYQLATQPCTLPQQLPRSRPFKTAPQTSQRGSWLPPSGASVPASRRPTPSGSSPFALSLRLPCFFYPPAPSSPVLLRAGCGCSVSGGSSSQTQSAALPRLPRRLRSLHPGTDSSRLDAGTMVMAEGTAVLRRNRPGTKAQDFYNWPDESFDEMDSTLAVQQCPAIDYTRHTLDGAACLLNSNKYFPSRVSIKESSVAKLGSVCRRIYRIFSHAYFHHRQIFDEYENETFLCHRFTKFVMKYNLMSKDNLIVPILEEEVQNSVSGESEA